MGHFELWDTLSGNVLNDFDTEDEALETVRSWIEADDLAEDPQVALLRVEASGSYSTLCSGADLVQRAREKSTRPDK